MNETNYQFKVNEIEFKDGTLYKPTRINVLVGANNCGKTQTLKDIMNYIIGTKNSGIILNEIKLNYPVNFLEMNNKYKFNIGKDDYGNERINGIKPTLLEHESFVSSQNVEESINNALKRNNEDYLRFRSLLGKALLTYINTENRLKLVNRQRISDGDPFERGANNVLEALYLGEDNDTQTLDRIVNDIFGKKIYLNAHKLGEIMINIGNDFSNISSIGQDADKQLRDYETIDLQGDGMRSVVGMICALVSIKRPIMLLDEPETFVHPPQMLQLGKIISSLVNDDQQIFIATHSVDFIKGIVNSNVDANIIHIDRSLDDKVSINILDSEELKNIVTDPLLSSTRVLEGLFYKGVVVTEADSDNTFYQRLFQKIGASDDIHFINAQNKQTLSKIVEPYKKLNIKCAMIADSDIIRNREEFKKTLMIHDDEENLNAIMNVRDKIIEHFSFKSRKEQLNETILSIKKLIEENPYLENDTNEIVEVKLNVYKKGLKEIHRKIDYLSDYKRKGINSLPDSLVDEYNDMYNRCCKCGLFIVKTGELESLLEDYEITDTKNKSSWIEKALKKINEISPDYTKEVWMFIKRIKEYLIK